MWCITTHIVNVRRGSNRFRNFSTFSGFPAFPDVTKSYLSQMINHGYNVAIVEETKIVEKGNQKLKHREVVARFTPGTYNQMDKEGSEFEELASSEDTNINSVSINNRYILAISGNVSLQNGSFLSHLIAHCNSSNGDKEKQTQKQKHKQKQERDDKKWMKKLSKDSKNAMKERGIHIGGKNSGYDDILVLSWIDVTTGQCWMCHSSMDYIIHDLSRIKPVEILLCQNTIEQTNYKSLYCMILEYYNQNNSNTRVLNSNAIHSQATDESCNINIISDIYNDSFFQENVHSNELESSQGQKRNSSNNININPFGHSCKLPASLRYDKVIEEIDWNAQMGLIGTTLQNDKNNNIDNREDDGNLGGMVLDTIADVITNDRFAPLFKSQSKMELYNFCLLLQYLYKHGTLNANNLNFLSSIEYTQPNCVLSMDYMTRKTLEIDQSLSLANNNNNKTNVSLVDILSKKITTPLGKRLLQNRISSPIGDDSLIDEIERRYDLIEWFIYNTFIRETFCIKSKSQMQIDQELINLASIGDFQRYFQRILHFSRIESNANTNTNTTTTAKETEQQEELEQEGVVVNTISHGHNVSLKMLCELAQRIQNVHKIYQFMIYNGIIKTPGTTTTNNGQSSINTNSSDVSMNELIDRLQTALFGTNTQDLQHSLIVWSENIINFAKGYWDGYSLSRLDINNISNYSGQSWNNYDNINGIDSMDSIDGIDSKFDSSRQRKAQNENKIQSRRANEFLEQFTKDAKIVIDSMYTNDKKKDGKRVKANISLNDKTQSFGYVIVMNPGAVNNDGAGFVTKFNEKYCNNPDYNLRLVSSTTNQYRFKCDFLIDMEYKFKDSKQNVAIFERSKVEQFIQQLTSINSIVIYLNDISKIIGEIDLSCAMAQIAVDFNYTRPKLIPVDNNQKNNKKNDSSLEIINGRHPIIEYLFMANTTNTLGSSGNYCGSYNNGISMNNSNSNGQFGFDFTPNDCVLSEKERVYIVSGPNMGGKSTYLRQNGLLIIMAQAGLYVPCTSMKFNIVDAIYSRVGSTDEIARNRSSFMVEMDQTSYILNHATNRSFIIMDEVGRGTSPTEGFAIAKSILHYIDQTIQCRCLFATHFHHLCDMAPDAQAIANYYLDVEMTATSTASDGNHEYNYNYNPDGLIFTYKVKKGVCKYSYGIFIAQLAGLPQSVINMAKQECYDTKTIIE